MAHKTLTISEDAYAALAGLKARGESFTDVILRLTAKTRKGTLLDYVRTMKPDEECAKGLEEIVKRRERAHIRNVPGKVDWHSMRGVLKGTKGSSVQLQHKIWSKDEIKRTRPRLRGVTSETIVRQRRNERHGTSEKRRKRTRRCVQELGTTAV